MTLIRSFSTIIFFFSFSILVAQEPQANNSYQTATTLTVQSNSCSSQTQGDLTNATNSNSLAYSSDCTGWAWPDLVTYADVWYTATVPSSGNLFVQTAAVSGSTLTNTMLFAYTLTDNELTEISCNHDDSALDSFATIRLTGLAENTEVYIMVVDQDQATGDDTGSDLGTFNICAYDPDLSPPANDDPENATALTVYETDSCATDEFTTGTWENSTHSGHNFDSNLCDYSSSTTTPQDVWYKLTVPQSGSFHLIADVEGLDDNGIFFAFYTLNEEVFTKFYCEQKTNEEIMISDRTAGEVIYVQLMSAIEIFGYGDSLHASVITICAFDDSSLISFPTAKPMLSYYSNPVGNRLSLESPYQIETLRVFDLMGKEVLHKTPNQQKLTLNTFTLAQGAYLLRVETPEGQQTVKLIKK